MDTQDELKEADSNIISV